MLRNERCLTRDVLMPIQIQCPNPKCQQTVSVQEEVSGRNVKCRKCGTAFIAVPTTDGNSSDKPLRPPGSDKGLFTSFPSDFGRYRILQLLGKGGMGAVYLAIDSQLNRKVALKIPFFDAKEEPKRAERFIREARAAASLNHPNICTVYDVGEVNGRPFITMAYIVGQPLEDLFDEDRLLPVDAAVEIIRKMALALQKAHDLSIVHRDLKPANVMITPEGEPVIMDFGLVKVIGEIDGGEARLTQEGAILGTPRYMAPEQVNGDQNAIGPATDIYALGVMLFELLTGQAPYSGALLTILSQIASSPLPNVRDFQSGVDEELNRVCRKAMEKLPASRFESMAQFADALLPFIPGSSLPSQRFRLTGVARSEAATVTGNVSAKTLTEPGATSEKNPAAETALPLGQKTSSTKATTPKTLMSAADLQPPETVGKADVSSGGPSFISRIVRRVGTSVRDVAADSNRLALFISGIAGLAIVVLVAAISIRHLTRNSLPSRTASTASIAGTESLDAGRAAGGDTPTASAPDGTTVMAHETGNVAPDTAVASIEGNPDAEAAANPAMDSSEVPVQNFVPMFNSSDMTGWTSVGGGGWSRNGDTIVAEARPGILLSERGYVDFELSLEYRLSRGGNSGVYVRVPDENTRPNGEDLIEVQLLDWSSLADEVAPFKSGSVIGFFPQVNRPEQKQGEWNGLRIVLQGDHIQTIINGDLVVDGELSEKTRTSSFTGVISKQGRIGLQQRGNGLTEFRNVRIRELSTTEAGTTETTTTQGMAKDQKQWRSLFNGRDLSGWSIARGSAANWSVQDSEDAPGTKELVAIAKSTESESWLMTADEYSDFTMRFEFRLLANTKTSGGIGFRMDDNDGQFLPIKIMDDSDPTEWAKQRGEKTGVVWTPTAAGPLMMFPPQQAAKLNPATDASSSWNKAELSVINQTLTLRINDQDVQKLDLDQEASRNSAATIFHRTRGKLGLQIRNGMMRFRKIEVRDETPPPVDPVTGGKNFSVPFEPLFNGNDLTGWREVGGKGGWSVKNGEIIVDGGQAAQTAVTGGWLVTSRSFSDYVLRFDYACESYGNSGLAFRFANDNQPVIAEIAFADEAHPEWIQKQSTMRTGSLNGLERDAVPAVKLRGSWNTMQVELRGDKLKVEINGDMTLDTDLKTHESAARAWSRPVDWRTPAPIALQKWTGVVRFRNIRIQDLSEATNAAGVSSNASANPKIPPEAKIFNGRAYLVYKETMSWKQAKTRCEVLGGKLAMSTSLEVNQFLTSLLNGAKLKEAWLGGADESTEGKWEWIDGRLFSYTNWHPGQPNDKGDGEDFLILMTGGQNSSSATWSDQPNVTTQLTPGFICEWPIP